MSSPGVVMATDEANVLELKEMYLSQVLLWTPRLRAALLEMEVVDQRQLDNIMRWPTCESKTKTLLNLLGERGSHNNLNNLINALENSKNSGLATLLRCELAAERRNLCIDPALKKEAEALVYREFAQNVRLSEETKKLLSQLLCLRSQCARDSWQQQLKDTEHWVECEKRRSEKLDTLAELLSDQIECFMEENNVMRRTAVHQEGAAKPMQDRPVATSGLVSSKEPLRALEDNVSHLERSASLALLAKEKIASEMERAFSVLNLRTEEVSMEQAITDVLERHNREQEGCKTRSKVFFGQRAVHLQHMKKFQKAATSAMTEKKRLMLDHINEFNIEKMRLDALKRRTVRLRERAIRAKQNQTDWRARYEYLAKGPRLRRIYERDAANTNGQPGVSGSRDGTNGAEGFDFPPMQYGVVLPPDGGDEDKDTDRSTDTPDKWAREHSRGSTPPSEGQDSLKSVQPRAVQR